MKKKYKFDELSTTDFCIVCGKALKKRVMEANPNTCLCYKCFKAEQRTRQMFQYKKPRNISYKQAIGRANRGSL